MITVILAKNKGVVFIDDEDAEKVAQYHWNLSTHKKHGLKYAKTNIPK